MIVAHNSETLVMRLYSSVVPVFYPDKNTFDQIRILIVGFKTRHSIVIIGAVLPWTQPLDVVAVAIIVRIQVDINNFSSIKTLFTFLILIFFFCFTYRSLALNTGWKQDLKIENFLFNLCYRKTVFFSSQVECMQPTGTFSGLRHRYRYQFWQCRMTSIPY